MQLDGSQLIGGRSADVTEGEGDKEAENAFEELAVAYFVDKDE